jgi:hypothetical protein
MKKRCLLAQILAVAFTIVALAVLAAGCGGSCGCEDGKDGVPGTCDCDCGTGSCDACLNSDAFWREYYLDCLGLVGAAQDWADGCGLYPVDDGCVRAYWWEGVAPKACHDARLEVAAKVASGDCSDPRPDPGSGEYAATCYPPAQ